MQHQTIALFSLVLLCSCANAKIKCKGGQGKKDKVEAAEIECADEFKLCGTASGTMGGTTLPRGASSVAIRREKKISLLFD